MPDRYFPDPTLTLIETKKEKIGAVIKNHCTDFLLMNQHDQ